MRGGLTERPWEVDQVSMIIYNLLSPVSIVVKLYRIQENSIINREKLATLSCLIILIIIILNGIWKSFMDTVISRLFI